MGFLFLMSGWLFGGDVEKLGDAKFWVRELATRRLQAVGWLAYPALWKGSESNDAERASRCGDLMERLDGPIQRAVAAEGVAKGVAPVPELADDSFMRLVCRRADQLGGWQTENMWNWVKSEPYRFGTKQGDFDYAVKTAVQVRTGKAILAPAIPQVMPKPAECPMR